MVVLAIGVVLAVETARSGPVVIVLELVSAEVENV
jgi:hypothetical protein